MSGHKKSLTLYPDETICLLGKVNDYILAEKFGVSQKVVWSLRKRLNISSYISSRVGTYICPICGKEFQRWKSQEERKDRSGILYCSRECQFKSLDRGHNHKIYGRNWRRIRKEVLKRDGKCMHCGTTKKLEVHHIIPFRISKSNSMNNLIVLCKSCHTREDARFRREN